MSGVPYRCDLTADQVREALSYDPFTGEFRWKKKRSNFCYAGMVAGSITFKGYVAIRLFRHSYPAHRLAWLLVHGRWPTEIDHIDADKTNNRIENLRECDCSQNQANNESLGYYFSKVTRKFVVRLKVNGRRIYVGSFDSEGEAREAYRSAHAKAHGEFSFVNRLSGGQAPEYAARLSAPSSLGAQR